MGLNISYMGTKRHLASIVADVIRQFPSGPVLDAFAGMGAVAEGLADERPVWVNDCQQFASHASKALFTSRTAPPAAVEAEKLLRKFYKKNHDELARRYAANLLKEEQYLTSQQLQDVIAGNTALPFTGSCPQLERERRRLAKKPDTFPYRMVVIAYSGSYFGLRQSIEIDSLIYSIDRAKNERLLTSEGAAWLRLAICQVASKVNNSTGHFAQYLKPSINNIDRIIQKRKRSVYAEFYDTIDSVGPIGSAAWRSENRAYNCDALALLKRFRTRKQFPSVIYADPPYTNAEYPRYYHILDTLFKYCYPPAIGVGRYPDKRKAQAFARVGSVTNAMRSFIARAARLNAALVMSYPGNGILHKNNVAPDELLSESYPEVEIVYSKTHDHSTFGRSNSHPTICAKELVYVAHK